MNRTYLFAPLVALAVFGSYYTHWRTTETPPMRRTSLSGDEYEGRSGQQEAEADLAAGKRVLLRYGLPLGWDHEFREVLQRKFGIEVRPVAGCVVTQPLVNYTAGYNRVMERRIIRELGADVFEVAEKEALALHTRRNL